MEREQARPEGAQEAGIVYRLIDRAQEGLVDAQEGLEALLRVGEPAGLHLQRRQEEPRLGRLGRAREGLQELVNQPRAEVVLLALERRPCGLEERLAEPVRILGNQEVVVEGVLVTPLFVRDPAERQPGQVTKRVIAAVDVEAQGVGVLYISDQAERILRALEITAIDPQHTA